MEGRGLNQELLDKYKKTLSATFEGYERILSKQKYLTGEVGFPSRHNSLLLMTAFQQTLTLADMFHIPSGKALESFEPGIFDGQPSVKRWWEEITTRESWRAVAA